MFNRWKQIYRGHDAPTCVHRATEYHRSSKRSFTLYTFILEEKEERKIEKFTHLLRLLRGEIENREGDKRNNRLTPVLLRGICEVSLDNARTRIVDEAPTTEQPNDLTGV